ncbi:DUF2219 family protein [Oceanobacter sp. 5_MG-2023]|jgi:hypothetical protein|uniref:lipid A-modifier LpxR family protein n=1 Tax=Oceanobacter sp. 5_MG-2023 TaxID=3062645 RepID=UPI0026E43FAF|nr:lipid A-modifier LpxR family protein [Oceanobacter sp. 5_MG-2023]MDO6683658.1 DUF2219 family protein [Oceanobacter sp. 5_MG-2023]
MKLIGAVCLLAACPLAMAEADDDSYSLLSLLFNNSEFEQRHVNHLQKIWRSQIENDALTGENITDQYYTNALNVRAYANLDGGFLLDGGRLYGFRCGPDGNNGDCDSSARSNVSNRDLKLVSYGYSLSHKMYTPYQHAGEGEVVPAGFQYKANAEYYDRPFAAWASIARNITIRGLDGYTEHEMSIGMVGPAAAGRWTQENAHRYPFKGADPIDGWETQVSNRLALQYTGKFARHLLQGDMLWGHLMISHFAKAELGTIIGRIGYGAELAMVWPQARRCERYAASKMLFVSAVAEQGVPLAERFDLYVQKLQQYLSGDNYIPDRIYLRIQALLVLLEGVDGEDMADVYRVLEQTQVELQALNSEMQNLALTSCHPDSFYTELSGNMTGHYVAYNYLIDDGIHVPAGSNMSSTNPVMQQGGTLKVHRNPWIASASFGVMVGWRDSWGLGVRYNYRTEETLEQKEQHAWAELVVEGKSNWAAAFIPVLLMAAAVNNRDNWPD